MSKKNIKSVTHLGNLFPNPSHVTDAFGSNELMVILGVEHLLRNCPIERRRVSGGMLPVETDLGQILVDWIGRLATAG